jgi:hypothetical protein
MTQFSFGWILSLNWLCQKWGQVHVDFTKLVVFAKTFANRSTHCPPKALTLGLLVLASPKSSVLESPMKCLDRTAKRRGLSRLPGRRGRDVVIDILFPLSFAEIITPFRASRGVQVTLSREIGRGASR